ncbi:hypothetical protein [Halovulum sp. GXIMD14793]
MKFTVRLTAVLAAATLLSGCLERNRNPDVIVDTGAETYPLKDRHANIWIDPDGCQHWWIDDGIEGYMTPRLNRDGTPVCEGQLKTKDGTVISDT